MLLELICALLGAACVVSFVDFIGKRVGISL